VFSAQTTSRHSSMPRRLATVADQGIVKTPSVRPFGETYSRRAASARALRLSLQRSS
jgi:hypothetical protein